MKKISIIVPVYNRQDYLEQTVHSVLGQTYPHFELLLIDDHSTDNSYNLCKQFQDNDKRITAIQRQSTKKGASVCRNEGLQMATGDYVIFLDSDDLLASYCLQQRLELVEQFTELDFAVFPMLLFNEQIDDLMVLQNVKTKENDLDRFLNRDMVWVISGPIWKRDALLKIGGLKEDLPGFQDMELHVKALCNSLNYKLFLDLVPDNFYRQDRTNAVSHKRDQPSHYTSQLVLAEHLVQLLKQNNLLSQERKLLVANFLLLIAVNWRFHLAVKNIKAKQNALQTWAKALELDLVTPQQHLNGLRYIRFKFNMKFNRIKWLQKRIEEKYIEKIIPELIWKRGSTQARVKYTGELQRKVAN